MTIKTTALVSLVVTALLAGSARASAPADYATIVSKVDGATYVMIRYYDGTTAMQSDPEWMSLLKRLVDSADAKPDDYCFCINYPQVTFVNKDGPIIKMEVPHGQNLRFYSKGVSGDFVVGEKTAKLVEQLLALPHDHAFKTRGPSPAPKRVAAPTPKKWAPLPGSTTPAPLQTAAPVPETIQPR